LQEISAQRLLFLAWQGSLQNLAIKAESTKARSLKNVEADAKRKATAKSTRLAQMAQYSQGFADRKHIEMMMLAAANESPAPAQAATTQAKILVHHIGDGTNDDDEDYEQEESEEFSDDDEISDSEDYNEPESKIPATQAPTEAVPVRTRKSAPKIRVNYTENVNGLVFHFDQVPTLSMYTLIGTKANYFEHPVLTTLCGRKCWFVDLNEKGKIRFFGDNKAAAIAIAGHDYTIVL
jgi:hypothetical protein